MLNLERLRALLAIRDHGSVAAAARALYVTPSGVSQQIAKLERETGHPLCERHGRGVRLTDAGVLLAEHARRLMAGLDAAEKDLADLHQQVLGPIRIGSLGSSIRLLVAPALQRLVAEHPRVTPTVVDGESVDLLPRLRHGELDLVIGERWPSTPSPMPASLQVETLVREPVGVALPAQHPLADRPALEFADLAGLTWVACDPSDIRDALVAALASEHVEPTIAYDVTEFDIQLTLVRSELAAALIPMVSVGAVPDGVRIVPVRPVLEREVYVASRADADRPVSRACLAALRDAANQASTTLSQPHDLYRGADTGTD